MAQHRQFSWRRSLAWAVSLALHLGLLVAMTLPRDADVPENQAWMGVEPAPAWVPVEVEKPPEESRVAQRADRPRVDPHAPEALLPAPIARRPLPDPTATTDAASPVVAVPAPVARTIAYLDDEARALLPQENLYSAKPPPREGDYYTPGNGSEDDVFYRPRALDPNPSRFAHAWQPRRNLVDGWLGRLVEKASGKVSVPLNAKFSLVCGTVAGIAGSCTIVRNGGTGVIVQRPPPAPWDRSNRVQCRELRQALEDAEEAVQVAYFLDRLSALCSSDDAAENDEARREAGLPEDRIAPEQARPDDQRAL